MVFLTGILVGFVVATLTMGFAGMVSALLIRFRKLAWQPVLWKPNLPGKSRF